MMDRFSPWDRALLDKIREAATRMSVTTLSEEPQNEGKGVVTRTRFALGGSEVLHTEIRQLTVTRVFVDATPLGAVVLILEMMKRRISPARIMAYPAEKAGEYRYGAFEVAYGFLPGEVFNMGNVLQFPGEPRRLKLQQVQDLARLALP